MFLTLRQTLQRLIARARNGSHAAILRADITRLLGEAPRNVALYERALTHRSLLRAHANGDHHSNERLEFLGDAVLGCVVAEHLYQQFPQEPEGFLTSLRAKLVNGQALAQQASAIGLGELILMSDDTVRSDGRHSPTILADALEAMIGALFLDQGIAAARRFIHRTMLDTADLETLAARRDNYKSLLLEFAQARGWAQPKYRVKSQQGPGHERTFTVEVLIGDTAHGSGKARNKKAAGQEAARATLQKFQC